jgi:hypothetical protein
MLIGGQTGMEALIAGLAFEFELRLPVLRVVHVLIGG